MVDPRSNTVSQQFSIWDNDTWTVRGIAPGAMEEPDNSNRDLSLIEWTVYADGLPRVASGRAGSQWIVPVKRRACATWESRRMRCRFWRRMR